MYHPTNPKKKKACNNGRIKYVPLYVHRGKGENKRTTSTQCVPLMCNGINSISFWNNLTCDSIQSVMHSC